MAQLKTPRYRFGGTLLAGLSVAAWVAVLMAADGALTSEQKEEFLRTAKIIASHNAAKGVTGTVRVTLSDGTITHDASVQTIDEFKTTFQGSDGHTEMNFKDTYKFNIAGWKLARLLGIDDMVPPSVERKYKGSSAAFTWWVEDVMMDEVDRTKKKLSAPDTNVWNADLSVMRVFDQLIYNTDSNMTNMLIDKQWHIWIIDHTRAFRTMRSLLNAKALGMCDRDLLSKMKALDQGTLEKELGPYVSKEEIKGLLARRDLIVKYFMEKGDGALYTRPRRI